MANFTQKAIKESLLKLLNEKPLNKISVKDIVEDCGINRNSFYYHFQDIPSLLEQMVTDQASEIIEEYPTIDSLDKCIEVATEFALKNRTAAMHIFNSVNRDVLERYIMNVCENMVTKYLDSALAGYDIKADDREIGIHLITCSLFGLVVDWMNSGMNEDAPKDISRICELCRGIPAEIIQRSLSN